MKIQRADPAARRRALIAVGLAAVAALALVVAGLISETGLRDQLDAVAAFLLASPRAGVVAMALGVSPLLLFAIYLFVTGGRVIRAGRFPLPGQRVGRDTPIREGRAAIVHGRVLQVLASLLGLSALGLPILLACVLASLTPG